MNLLLLHPAELDADQRFQLPASDRRAQHLLRILKLEVGAQIGAGVLNGLMGTATLVSKDSSTLIFLAELTVPAPPPLELTLIIGLPRPKMLRRIIQSIASLGVKEIILLNTYKVEKSYWQSPWLQTEQLQRQCLLGLEQARDTQLPEIHQYKLFKPFVEDVLPQLTKHRDAWFAHPGVTEAIPKGSANMILAIGPEGGFTPYEVEKLGESGMQGFHIGNRILRVETVIPALIGHFFFSY